MSPPYICPGNWPLTDANMSVVGIPSHTDIGDFGILGSVFPWGTD